FVPDGWGAMLVLATGRAFDWLPWCAVSALTVDPAREPTLEAASKSRLVLAEDAGEYCVPLATHLKGMKMQRLGTVPLDPAKARAQLTSQVEPAYAVACGWSYVSVLKNWRSRSAPGEKGGARVADLA